MVDLFQVAYGDSGDFYTSFSLPDLQLSGKDWHLRQVKPNETHFKMEDAGQNLFGSPDVEGLQTTRIELFSGGPTSKKSGGERFEPGLPFIGRRARQGSGA